MIEHATRLARLHPVERITSRLPSPRPLALPKLLERGRHLKDPSAELGDEDVFTRGNEAGEGRFLGAFT